MLLCSMQAFVSDYSRRRTPPHADPDAWLYFYLAFAFFKLTVIAHGIAAREARATSSNARRP
jgi:hypothetical protein